MKLPELIANIKSTLYNNRVPNTALLDNRQIIYWINEMRAMFLKREYNQLRSPLHNEIQTLYNIEMEIVDNNTLPIDMKSNTLLKSKQQIPRTIQWNISDGVLGIYGIETLSESINYTTRRNVVNKGNGKFNRKEMWAFKYDDYLWVKYGDNSDKSRIIKNIRLEGVFENPLEVDKFNGTEDEIRLGNSEYPVSEAFLIFIEQQIYQTHIQRFIKDIQNDDEEEYKGQQTANNNRQQ